MDDVIRTTARLHLRPFVLTDFAWLHPIAANPIVTRWTTWGPNTEADTRDFLATAARNGSGPGDFLWAVSLTNDTGIGSASLHRDAGDGQASFGYTLDPNFWGNGYATEVSRAILDHAFGTLGLHRMQATCHPDNTASARVLEKAGLTFEGRMRGHRLVRGQWRDSLLYAVLASDPRH